jgi:hypothetical protein
MPKVPGAEPIQPMASQPGQGAREKALERDEQATEDKTGANAEKAWAHEVRGKVAGVDRGTGVVRLEDTADFKRPLSFQFTPESVANLSIGEAIVTRVSYAKVEPGHLPAEDGGPMPATANKMKQESGQRSVSGTVVDVDKGSGRVSLRSDETTLYVEVPARFAESLAQGDKVNLEMAFSRQES